MSLYFFLCSIIGREGENERRMKTDDGTDDGTMELVEVLPR